MSDLTLSSLTLSSCHPKLRELERGLNRSDREERINMYSAFDALDD